MTDINDRVNEVASGPKRVQGDAGSVEQHSISDLLKLADRESAALATSKRGWAARPQRCVPPGAV